MKNNKFLITIYAMVVTAIISVAVVSCKKEKQEPSSSNNTERAVQSADNMDEYLISFKKKLLSAQKGDETISLEQAQRDLGNLLNFDFGDANYPTDEYRYDTILLKLSLSNGQVNLSQLAIIYNAAVSTILNLYRAIDLPEKSVYAISCNFNETESKDGEMEDVEIVLITRGLTTPLLGAHDTLDWRPKDDAGTCDGQFVGYRGAPEVIADWIKDTQEEISCVNGGRLYFTDEGRYETYGSWHFDPIAGKYKIFTYYGNNIDTICIPHEDMEYYFANILNLWQNSGITERCIRNVYIHAMHFIDGLEFWTWRVRLYYAKPNCTDIDPLQ